MVLRPEQFTEQAQEVLHNSQELVRRYRHSQWDVEHVLLSLLELENGLPSQILADLGVPEDQVKARLHQALEASPKVTNESNQIYATPPGGTAAGQRQAGSRTIEGRLHRR